MSVETTDRQRYRMARKFVLLFVVSLLSAAFVATDFMVSATGPSISKAQERKRGLLQRLFRPRDNPPPKKTVRPRDNSPLKKAVRPGSSSSAKRRVRQLAGYRTLCVRTCDGYYFPISHSIGRSRFKTDEAVCKAMYGGAGAELFVLAGSRSAEQAVSLSRQPLVSQPYAFAYRSKFNESCQRELKSGLAHLEKVFATRIAEAKANATAPPGAQKQSTLPVPTARISPSEDLETLANRAGRFTAAPVEPMALEEIALAAIVVRRLGPDYYYIAPIAIDTLYEPPDLGPRFTLIGAAHAADQEANKDATRSDPTVTR